MKASTNCRELIQHFEGFQPKPYRCPGGYWTIGYGHLIDSPDRGEITRGEAALLLSKDMEVAERAVLRQVKVPLNQGQFDALVSFTFNLGSGALQASTLRRKLNQELYWLVPEQLRRWVFAGGRKLPGLIRRREAEVALWNGLLPSFLSR